MTIETKAYWAGFEDGFADAVCRDNGLSSREAWAYRKGFRDGLKAHAESQS